MSGSKNINVCTSLDPVSLFRVREFAKQEATSISNAVRILIERSWNAHMSSEIERLAGDAGKRVIDRHVAELTA